MKEKLRINISCSNDLFYVTCMNTSDLVVNKSLMVAIAQMMVILVNLSYYCELEDFEISYENLYE